MPANAKIMDTPKGIKSIDAMSSIQAKNRIKKLNSIYNAELKLK
ncbi:MAG: hypothetical protein UT98_C0002G0144 [Candidatus Nomurabacteria bacterium GW2011_GWF2_40_31]|uniref:Uncharacterized protein n=2 Tax=Candidatus Nomuraibacteriota TaxID=1752729 RepID=A0A837HUL5_9BACT|nr:MAG: hypothetical protein UT27_C0002G0050 [Candidatus Nomurabacteria bacterium GW2011_GWD2_39_12]KKR21006.1 MAG: hypothetical protein UT51_C0001G0144 [Candidatus Nomurabacteria bacterium GW2011_GWC2_39_41]KKR37009.1 MAG: hypothetical protein UT70_C0004G0052 [Candidatus Nomurabacteria bacterium GW2011_GWE2_40_10]KKR38955.1 MAG: hypothetical protein UT73_C0001G0143 [Candidatus Nomurabacteria bacterium GW2011_GWB1_40_11]KKR40197.1 MAG: hypothetical protein UT74_C0002G0092 [Parcubacteria group b